MAKNRVYDTEITVDGKVERYEVLATSSVQARDLLITELKPKGVGLHVEAEDTGRNEDGEPRVLRKLA